MRGKEEGLKTFLLLKETENNRPKPFAKHVRSAKWMFWVHYRQPQSKEKMVSGGPSGKQPEL